MRRQHVHQNVITICIATIAATAATGQATSPAVSAPTSQPLTTTAPAELTVTLDAAATTAPADAWQPATSQASQPAAKKPITREVAIGPEGKVDFDGSYISGLRWSPKGRHYFERRDDILQAVEAVTDAATPAYDYGALESALRNQAGFDEKTAERAARRPETMNEDQTVALVRREKRLFYYDFATAALRTISEQADTLECRQLSPKAGYVGFVRGNNLFTIDTRTARETQLTSDGADELLNGKLDWVYQEEVYGRGRWDAYWFSPDDSRIAFLQLNETGVPKYSLVDSLDLHPAVETFHYPKPGDKNPTARLGVLSSTGGATTWVDLTTYANQEILIVRVSWSPAGRLLFHVQNRNQTWLDLNEADPATGSMRTLFRDHSAAWVEPLDEPRWLDDGTFLWLSERDGWRHLYHYSPDGKLIRRITAGAWEVRDVHGIDAAGGWVYFSGTRDSAIQQNAYRVRLDGGPLERLTMPGFHHSTRFDPQCRMFIDTFSNVEMPHKVHLRKADGQLIRVISENEIAAIAEYEIPRTEFVRVPARDGYLMNASMILPPDYDPNRRYPVWIYTYAGPHAPSVSNSWAGGRAALNWHIATQGYVVWTCDNRSASGDGAISAWQAYCRLGETELDDIEDGVRWLINQGIADPERIGIYGHSYGGYMTAYAMTHSTMFKLGIAGAPVTDWRHYDTIYTERYMLTPKENPAGYDSSSIVKAAKDLSGRLILLHGMADDNVHPQNTMKLIYELQQARKLFGLMLYPRDTHGIWHGRNHMVDMRLDELFNQL
ncbi:MAG: S9 family peptidase [Phycisphaerales bacterium]|nr:S9 family peptidase [Phycisphaerales bacterium]